jgi:TusA-related sulfurtransferase
MDYKIKQQIDARGSHCPGPLMELVRFIKSAEVGEIIDLLSADEGSKKDVPLWVEKAGHKMLEIVEEDDFRHFIVEKGEKKKRERRRRERDA